MNCPYCNIRLYYQADQKITDGFRCYHCPVDVTLWYTGSWENPHLTDVSFNNRHYFIIVHYEHNYTMLFDDSTIEQTLVARLNYAADITPSTFRQWIDRLVGLSAFS